MIDHKNHYARYCELISLAASSAPARQRDGGYMAAVYILSADKTLCDIARRKICPDGISFPVFCPSPAGRNCLTVNLQPSAPLTIYSMAAPVPLLPPMISPSAII